VSRVLGIDIGGTGIKSAIVNVKTGEIKSNIIYLATPQPSIPAAIISEIKGIISDFSWSGKIGCGFPGVIKTGKVLSAANLSKQWLGVDLKKEIKNISKHEVRIINDADAAAVAEMNFGAGKDYNKPGGGVVFIVTLGTGIGTAVFVDGHPLPNTEFGHIELNGMDAEKQAATVVREKENLSWEQWGARVNQYLQMMEMLLSPDIMIIGGGVSESCEKFFPYLDVKAKIVSAKLGNDAGIVGAGLALQL
jgi:polyphosphate glucokinase